MVFVSEAVWSDEVICEGQQDHAANERRQCRTGHCCRPANGEEKADDSQSDNHFRLVSISHGFLGVVITQSLSVWLSPIPSLFARMDNLGDDTIAARANRFVFGSARLVPDAHSVFDSLTLQIP